jgi:hypothetical protein
MLHRSKEMVVPNGHVAMLFLRLTFLAFCIGVAVNVAVAGVVLLLASVGG